MKSQTSTERTKASQAEKYRAESEENISAIKQNQNVHNDNSAIWSLVVSRVASAVHTHIAREEYQRKNWVPCLKIT